MSSSVTTDAAFFDRNRLNAANALGTQHSSYKSAIFALALAKPQDYFAMRDKTVTMLKDRYLNQIQKDLYDLLTIGKVGGVAAISNAGVNFTPNMPLQMVNQYCMDAAASIDEILGDAIKKILPVDIDEVMQKRLGVIGKQLEP